MRDKPQPIRAYAVRSFTDASKQYLVVKINSTWACTCLDWHYRLRPCKHIRYVQQAPWWQRALWMVSRP